MFIVKILEDKYLILLKLVNISEFACKTEECLLICLETYNKIKDHNEQNLISLAKELENNLLKTFSEKGTCVLYSIIEYKDCILNIYKHNYIYKNYQQFFRKSVILFTKYILSKEDLMNAAMSLLPSPVNYFDNIDSSKICIHNKENLIEIVNGVGIDVDGLECILLILKKSKPDKINEFYMTICLS